MRGSVSSLTLRSLTLPGVLLLALACSEGPDNDSAAEISELEAVEVLRVGSAEDPDYAFTWFRELEVAPNGRVYTLHSQTNEIRVHDPDGRLIQTFGGQGEGPGELQNPGSMGLLADTLWVLDFGTYRFSYFDLDGGLIRSVRVPVELGGDLAERPPRPAGLLADGSIHARPPAWSRLVASGEIAERVVLRMDEDGAPGDTLFRHPLANTVLAVTIPNDPRSRGSYAPQPWSDTELAEISPAELAYVRVRRRVGPEGPGHPRVTKTGFDGTELFSVELPAEAVPLESDEMDAFVERWVDRLSQGFFSDIAPGRIEQTIRERLYDPGFHPPVSEMVVGRDGSVWLAGPKLMDEEVTRWTVLDPEGVVVGSVELPRSFSIREADVGRAWGMQPDELDVPHIVSFEIKETG